MKKIALVFLVASATMGSSLQAASVEQRDDVKAFVQLMVDKHDFKSTELLQLFKKVEMREDIIELMTRPAEGKPWHEYRPIFVTKKRTQGGVKFWNENSEILLRAEKEYGVPPEIITAIIGVETRYGGYIGKHRVIDALATLGFDYPKRAKFFSSELEHFLLLMRDEAQDPLVPVGSYAGAMGIPQFIPSSYRHYAVDFDGDGKRDLWNNRADVIGSVASYFQRHGWQSGQPVVSQVKVKGDGYLALLKEGIKPKHNLKHFRDKGVIISDQFSDELPAALLEFETKSEPEYWIGLQNFYTITRYNHSKLYAMAVYQLAMAIRDAHENQTGKVK